jgi:hypothetical protein
MEIETLQNSLNGCADKNLRVALYSAKEQYSRIVGPWPEIVFKEGEKEIRYTLDVVIDMINKQITASETSRWRAREVKNFLEEHSKMAGSIKQLEESVANQGR